MTNPRSSLFLSEFGFRAVLVLGLLFLVPQMDSSPTEVVTAVTNLPLAFVSLVAVRSLHLRRRAQPLRAWLWIGMFGGLAVATTLGVFAHGLALDAATKKLIWHPINAALGLTVASFVAGAVLDGWGAPAARRLLPIMLLLSAGFFAYATFWSDSFLPFILYEGVAMLFCFGVYLTLSIRRLLPGAGWLAAGVGITIVAAVLQATPVAVRIGVTFDHNGVFHLVQLPGLCCLLIGLKLGLGLGQQRESTAAGTFSTALRFP